jgi:xanthine/uracil permease
LLLEEVMISDKARSYCIIIVSFTVAFFMFANTVVVPITVGSAFQLPAETIEMTIGFSFIFTGIASILQS